MEERSQLDSEISQLTAASFAGAGLLDQGISSSLGDTREDTQLPLRRDPRETGVQGGSGDGRV